MTKKITLFFVLYLSTLCIGNAQNKISFTELNIQKDALKQKFKSYRILELNDDLQRISQGQQITITLGQDYSFTLKENRLVANNHIVSIKGENGMTRKTLDELGFDGRYFTNEDATPNKQLAFSMFEDRYSFYIKSGTKEFYIEPLKNTDKSAASNQYVYYETKDIVREQTFSCGFKDENHKAENPNQLATSAQTGGCKTVGLEFLVDYTVYQIYGTVNASINRTLEILNLSQVNYTMANGLSDDINFKVYDHCIITCETCNQWPLTPEISENFDYFYFVNSYQLFVYPQDKIRICFQSESGTGPVAGLANHFQCSITGSTVIKNFAADTDLTRQVLSHEMGHNLHCEHTTGFIMNPFTNYATTWAPESITTINNTINTLACITDCNPLLCEDKKVTDIVVTPNTSTQQVTISWTSEPGMDYKVMLVDYSSPTWPNDYTTLSYPVNSITYPISQVHCNDQYRFIIVPRCNNTDGIAENIRFKISQNAAAPALIDWSGFKNEFSGVYTFPNLCNGNPYFCTITGIDGGTAPVYQWRVNGLDVGTNSNTLNIETLQNNDVLSCELTSNATCVLSPTATFSTVVHVVDPIPLEITLENIPDTTICTGESITLDQHATINFDYQPFVLGGDMIIESYFNGVPLDLYTVWFQGLPVARQFTFTPTESGFFHCEVHLSLNTNGTPVGCYTNQEAYSIPIYVTVNPQPCDLAVSDFEISRLNYYPNPATDVMTIEAKETISDIMVYTVLGQKVLAETLNSNHATLNISALAKGTYFLKVHANGKTENIKILKE